MRSPFDDDEQKVKVEFIYGFTCTQPTYAVKLGMDSGTWLQRLWWTLCEIFYWISQAFLFALAFTAFKYALLA